MRRQFDAARPDLSSCLLRFIICFYFVLFAETGVVTICAGFFSFFNVEILEIPTGKVSYGHRFTT